MKIFNPFKNIYVYYDNIMLVKEWKETDDWDNENRLLEHKVKVELKKKG